MNVQKAEAGGAVETFLQVSSDGTLKLLRSNIQAVPVVGSAVDALFLGVSSNIKRQQLEQFYELLTFVLREIASLEASTLFKPDADLHDFVNRIHEGVFRTRTAEKRKRYVHLFAQQVVKPRAWDEAISAVDLLNSLNDFQFEVLLTAHNFSKGTGLAGVIWREIVLLDKSQHQMFKDNSNFDHPNLYTSYSGVPIGAVKAACSQLVAQGLLADVGVGIRGDVGPLMCLSSTDFAAWFIDWLQIPQG